MFSPKNTHAHHQHNNATFIGKSFSLCSHTTPQPAVGGSSHLSWWPPILHKLWGKRRRKVPGRRRKKTESSQERMDPSLLIYVFCIIEPRTHRTYDCIVKRSSMFTSYSSLDRAYKIKFRPAYNDCHMKSSLRYLKLNLSFVMVCIQWITTQPFFQPSSMTMWSACGSSPSPADPHLGLETSWILMLFCLNNNKTLSWIQLSLSLHFQKGCPFLSLHFSHSVVGHVLDISLLLHFSPHIIFFTTILCRKKEVRNPPWELQLQCVYCCCCSACEFCLFLSWVFAWL